MKIANVEQCDLILDLLEKAEWLCLVSRTLGFPIRFEPQVQVTETGQSLWSDS